LGILVLSGAAVADRPRPATAHGFLHDHSLRLGVDTELGIPLGNYADQNSVGGGAFVSSELAMMELLSATLRIGFQAHMDRTVGGTDSHVHAIPILLGTKYYLGPDRQGMFGAFELGIFDLMSSVSRGAVSATSNDVRFGMGAGLGYEQGQWNARVNVHTQDDGHFGNAMMITGGIGYQFGGF